MYIDVQNLKNKMNVAVHITEDEKLLEMIENIANDIVNKTFNVNDLIIVSDYIINFYISHRKNINKNTILNVLFTKVVDFFHYSVYINASMKENALLYKTIFNDENYLIYNQMYVNKCKDKDSYFIYYILSNTVNQKKINNENYKFIMSLMHDNDNSQYIKMLYYIIPEFISILKETDKKIFINYINYNKTCFSDIINQIIKMPLCPKEMYDIFHKETEDMIHYAKDVSMLNKNNANIIINNIIKHNVFDEDIIKSFLKVKDVLLYKPEDMDYNIEIINNATELILKLYYKTNVSPYYKNLFYNKFISIISESSNTLMTELPRYVNNENKHNYDYYINKFATIMNFSINNELVDINILLRENLLYNALDKKIKFNIRPFCEKNKSKFLNTIKDIEEKYSGQYGKKILKNVFDVNFKSKLLSIFTSKENLYYFDKIDNNENLTLLIENKNISIDKDKKEEITPNNNEKEDIAKLFDDEEINKEIKEVINYITTTYEKMNILAIELNKDDELFLKINAINEYNYILKEKGKLIFLSENEDEKINILQDVKAINQEMIQKVNNIKNNVKNNIYDNINSSIYAQKTKI